MRPVEISGGWTSGVTIARWRIWCGLCRVEGPRRCGATGRAAGIRGRLRSSAQQHRIRQPHRHRRRLARRRLQVKRVDTARRISPPLTADANDSAVLPSTRTTQPEPCRVSSMKRPGPVLVDVAGSARHEERRTLHERHPLADRDSRVLAIECPTVMRPSRHQEAPAIRTPSSSAVVVARTRVATARPRWRVAPGTVSPRCAAGEVARPRHSRRHQIITSGDPSGIDTYYSIPNPELRPFPNTGLGPGSCWRPSRRPT